MSRDREAALKKAEKLLRQRKLTGALMRALALDTTRHRDVVRIAHDLVTQGRSETAFGGIDAAPDAALPAGEFEAAGEWLERAADGPAATREEGFAVS